MIERQANRTALAFALLSALALAAFWPHYFRPMLLQGKAAPLPLMHVHAALMLLWLVMLVSQPLFVARRALVWHQRIGRLAWLLAPAIVLSSVLLAVQMTRPAPGEAVAPFRYGLFFLQIGVALLFGACVGVALARRRDRAVHARAMLASGLTLLDPILARVFSALAPAGTWAWLYGSMVLSAALIALVIALDRRAQRGRWVFFSLFVGFVVVGAGSHVIDRADLWREFVDRI